MIDCDGYFDYQMNKELISPFLSSMSNVLATMASMESQAGQPRLKKDKCPSADITGLIALSSTKAVGTLAISFTSDVILDVASRMLMEQFKVVNEEIVDLVGEITNMVTGSAKQLLEEKGFDFDMATPIVIQGQQQYVTHLSDGPTIVVPYSTHAGDFYVEMSFKSK